MTVIRGTGPLWNWLAPVKSLPRHSNWTDGLHPFLNNPMQQGQLRL